MRGARVSKSEVPISSQHVPRHTTFMFKVISERHVIFVFNTGVSGSETNVKYPSFDITSGSRIEFGSTNPPRVSIMIVILNQSDGHTTDKFFFKYSTMYFFMTICCVYLELRLRNSPVEEVSVSLTTKPLL